MGGGGSIGMMNSTIKNNRNLLKRHRKSLEYIYSEGSSKKPVEYNLPKVHQKTIKMIGDRVKRENQQLFYKRIFVFGLVVSSVIVILMTII